MNKETVRKDMILRRNKMPPKEVLEKSVIICSHIRSLKEYKNARSVMLYNRIGNEADMKPLVEELFKCGKEVFLPVTGDDLNITAARIYPETVYKKGKFGVYEPERVIPSKKNDIDMVIVPGVAFDRYGARIGYGKGCYDAFLSGIGAIKAGVCFEFQIADRLIMQEHDIKMDILITEKGMIKIE